ncbi:CLUMA_CG012852, isoform A [Clunio marinus]|uniref:CLUMA_CG012852, isoform A n=1 Tax=Clunio marinus TaxID=568069 RepID=A0A1J1IH05_9DIPT|nr:CLUMA_CG012852, isoform A [Clunio marinus]
MNCYAEFQMDFRSQVLSQKHYCTNMKQTKFRCQALNFVIHKLIGKWEDNVKNLPKTKSDKEKFEMMEKIRTAAVIPTLQAIANIKRFPMKVNYVAVTLLRKKIFLLSRQVVLTVKGAIITYKLVLIQFKANDIITDYNPFVTGGSNKK